MAHVITRAQESSLAPPGTTSFVTGWGHTGTSFPRALREVSVPIVSRDRCNSARSYDGEVTSRMFCAGLREGARTPVRAILAARLMVMDKLGRFQMQAGIVSWGAGCALPNLYGVYSRLAVLEKWVSAKMAALRASAVSALACETSGGGASSPACRRADKDEAEREMAGYLDAINRAGTSSQARDAAAAQRAWSLSVSGICALEARSGRAARAGRLSRERSAQAGRRARRPAFGSAQLMR